MAENENENIKATPLKVSVTHKPTNRGLGNEIAIQKGIEIINEVLENLQYDGTWTVAVVKQTTKRFNIRFQVSRRDGIRGILVRTKPYDNGTCWESILTPPEKYDAKEVMSALERVHPTKLIVKRLTSADIDKVFAPRGISLAPRDIPPPSASDFARTAAKKTIKDIVLSFAEAHPKGFKIEAFVKEFRQVGIKPHEEKRLTAIIKDALNSLIASGIIVRDTRNCYGKPSKEFPEVIPQEPTTKLEKIQLEKIELNEVDKEIKVRLEQPPAINVATKDNNVMPNLPNFDLALPYDCEVPLHKDDKALSFALVALYLSIDDKYSQIIPHETTNILISKLKLDQYVENQDNYGKPMKAAAGLIKGLVEGGYLHREHYASGDSTRTKYFNFTNKGIEAIESIIEICKKVQQERGGNMPFRPNGLTKRPQRQVDQGESPVIPTPTPTPTAQVIERNMGDLQPLVQELEKIQASIVTYDDMEKQAKLDLNTTLDAISGLKSRIEALNEQLLTLNGRMATYEKQEIQLNHDLEDVQLHREEEKGRMMDIKLKIRNILKLEGGA